MKINDYTPILTEQGKSLPIYTASVGISENEIRIYRPDGIEDWQILYSAKGDGEAEAGERKFRLSEGSIMIFPPRCPHIYRAVSKKWTTYWITYNGIAANFASDRTPRVTRLKQKEEFENIFFELIDSEGRENAVNRSSIIMYRLLLLSRNIFLDERSESESEKMSRVVNYISAHCREQLSLEELAAEAGISKGHFCRLFKAYSGKRPFEYINAVRLTRAKAFLRYDRDMSVARISREAGFASESYFIKLFKRSEGKTPAEYRKEFIKLCEST